MIISSREERAVEQEGSIVSETFSNRLDSEGVKLNFVCFVERRAVFIPAFFKKFR